MGLFSKQTQRVLINAEAEAIRYSHEYLCVEHLLYSLLSDPAVVVIIESCEGDVDGLKRQLEDFFQNKLEGKAQHPPQQTFGFQRVLQRAVLHTQYSSAEHLSTGDLLATIFTETESHAAYFLQSQGISRLDVLDYVCHGTEFEEITPDEESQDGGDDANYDSSGSGDFAAKESSAMQVLQSYAVDLVSKAQQGHIDPIIGRESELQRMIEILSRRQKNNPLLVGDHGVGKTAIAEGFALMIAKAQVPKRFLDMRVFSLDVGALLAGTKYRGDFEKRLKKILAALETISNAALVIDEIHTIVGAGAVSGGSLDLANMLKPALASGRLRCIGSTTHEEYKRVFSKDSALARRFLKLDIGEPSIRDSIAILEGLKETYEKHHEVRYSSGAIRASVELAGKYINERFLPDKAIDVMDEAGAALSLAQADKENKGSNIPVVRTAHIEKVVSKIAGVPTQTVTTSDRDKLEHLEEELTRVVFGQEEAIATVCRAIRRARAGLVSDNKPIGCFLFAGPTGVGKTEVCRQLAKVLGLELIRFDMSEYMEKHAVARLIGAPPGYVGFEQGGLLTDKITRSPHSVLLLDEIEKAHPDLFNILLQVMDNASLTDNNGRKSDFRNVILVMTSNAGSEMIHGNPIGFEKGEPSVGQGAIDKTFRPEFRNRLDATVKFKPLSPEIARQVVDKFISEIDHQLLAKHANIVTTQAARAWIADRGYSKQYGARSVGRLIQKEIKDRLADEMLFGQLSRGGTCTVDVVNGALKLVFKQRQVNGKKEKQKVPAI